MNTTLTIVDGLSARPAQSVLFEDDHHRTTSAAVLEFIERMRISLRAADVGDEPVVSVVLPSGQALALVGLALMAVATCAPLNPRLTEQEFASVFADLGAAALVTSSGFSDTAARAAERCGLALIEIDDELKVQVRAARARNPANGGEGHARSALLLHTSGTTARPKLVGLSERNVMSSATAVARTLQLDARDRCLSVMPMFHIHGLVGVLLATVVGGSSIFFPRRFDPFAFRRHLHAPGITWTSAVPSMYGAMLLREAEGPPPGNLRFVRSSSSVLPASTWRGLESALGCVVVNAFGMTEAAHQMASNPLAPLDQRIDTVGRSAGSEVAILNAGAVTTTPSTGEVVVRGPSLMSGYLSPPGADHDAWQDGWFRTGDLGSLDADGYLTLHGRLKEIINVAGEKVSPFEVEAVFRDHPAVADVVAFAGPHRLRGEQVCVAVVLREGAQSPQKSDWRTLTEDRLAAFKRPRRIVEVDAIPLGPTGKVQRARLAEQLSALMTD